LEKFKYANQATAIDVLREFGTKEVLSKKIISCNQTNGSLRFMDGLDREKLKSVLGVDFKEINEEYNRTIFQLLPRGRVTGLRHKFTFCRACLSHGYHSIFHQFVAINHCPYHKRRLENCCPKCKLTLDYRLSDQFKNPFQCNCGYKFIQDSENFTKCWTRFKPKIKNEAVQRWISLTDEKKEVLQNLVVFNEINYERYPHALEQILSVIDPEFVSNDEYCHVISKTSKNIRAYDNRLKEYEKVCSDRNNDRLYIKFMNQIQFDIYWSTAENFSSIAKHIRKTFLQHHKSCLYRAKRGKMNCRYADVYIHWCKFIHNFRNCWQVDNHYYPKRPKKDEIRFVSMQDHDELWWVIKAWNGDRNRIYESMTSTKWVVSKFLNMILLNHFYNWVRVATNRKSTEEIMYLPFQYQNLPMAVLKIPENKGKELEFHIWIKKEQIVPISDIKLNCPYNRVKKRRNHLEDFADEETEIRSAAFVERL
jgi:hypothetical protein